MNETPETSRGGRLTRIAAILAVVGLVLNVGFMWIGFGPTSVGFGFFLGVPLLKAAIVLYLIAVVRDLRRGGVL